MERTIICATIDFLEEYKETLKHTGGYTKTDDQLKETIAYWKNEANRAETLVIKPNGGLTEREKSLILWFMELAVKMKMKDYTELSIASIDLDAWYEDYYKENELPLNALEIDEREGL